MTIREILNMYDNDEENTKVFVCQGDWVNRNGELLIDNVPIDGFLKYTTLADCICQKFSTDVYLYDDYDGYDLLIGFVIE